MVKIAFSWVILSLRSFNSLCTHLLNESFWNIDLIVYCRKCLLNSCCLRNETKSNWFVFQASNNLAFWFYFSFLSFMNPIIPPTVFAYVHRFPPIFLTSNLYLYRIFSIPPALINPSLILSAEYNLSFEIVSYFAYSFLFSLKILYL